MIHRVIHRVIRRAFVLAGGLVFAACSGGGHVRGGPPTTTSGPASTTTAAAASPDVISGFVVFGDFGGGDAQGAVAATMTRWASTHRVDALVTVGDNVYPDGSPTLYAAQLDRPYAALRRPMWITLGNHDAVGGHGDRELAHFRLPRLPYVKDLPGVRLLFVDANRPDDAQAAWLDSRLAEPGPAFRAVVFHQPAWSCGLHGSTAEVDARWVPVFERHRVALVLNGHDHDYERFVSGSDVTYVVTGGGGQTLYPLRAGCTTGAHQVAAVAVHHFVGVEVRTGSLTLTAVAADGAVIDQATIRR